MHAQRFGYEGPGYDGPEFDKPSIASLLARKAAINFLRQPVQASGLIVMGVASLTIMANALFLQPGMHPAPFFAKQAPQQVAAIAPLDPVAIAITSSVQTVAPILRPSEITTDRIARVRPLDLSNPQGNKQTYEFQTLLAELGFFAQKRDGYYGPATANAIRSFEKYHGLKTTGQLSDELKTQLYTVRRGGRIAAAQPVAATAPQPVFAVRPVLTPRARPIVRPSAITQILTRPNAPSPDIIARNIAAAVAQVATKDLVAEQILAQPKDALSVLRQAMPQTPVAQVAVVQSPVIQARVAQPQPVTPNAPNRALVESIQRGLFSLGYLHGEVDGVAGDVTAAAVREFENYNRFPITGEINAHMLTLLIAAKADIS